MFIKKGELNELRKEIKQLNSEKASTVLLFDENNELKAEIVTVKVELEIVKSSVSSLRSDIEDKLSFFHKEISDKYIKAIESILQTTKETMLIDTLIKQTNEKDMSNLKRIIMQPIIEERIKEGNKERGKQIESDIQTRGELLLAEKRKLHDEFLKLQRENKDTKYIEGQLNVLEQITKEGI